MSPNKNRFANVEMTPRMRAAVNGLDSAKMLARASKAGYPGG
jgi:hypothetical protein